jgi:hypothetical protein
MLDSRDYDGVLPLWRCRLRISSSVAGRRAVDGASEEVIDRPVGVGGSAAARDPALRGQNRQARTPAAPAGAGRSTTPDSSDRATGEQFDAVG